MKKKKKVGKYILLMILLLIVAGIVAVLVKFLPLWRAAKDFESGLDLGRFSFVLDVELEDGKLTEEQRGLLSAMAEMNGLDEKSLLKLHLEGSVWDDKIYVRMMPAGAPESEVEFYLSNAVGLINAGPIYNRIRSGLVEQNALMDRLLPAPVGDVFMTLEQAEQFTGKDLGNLKKFRLSLSQYRISALGYFAAMAAVPFVKGAEDGGLILEERKEDGNVCLHLAMRRPSELLNRNLETYGKWIPDVGLSGIAGQIEGVKTAEITLTSGNAREVVMPTKVMDSKLPDAVEKIRELLEQLNQLPQALQQAAVDEYVRQHGELQMN